MILIRGESQNQGAQERENAQPDAWFLCSRLNEIDPLLIIGIYMTYHSLGKIATCCLSAHP